MVPERKRDGNFTKGGDKSNVWSIAQRCIKIYGFHVDVGFE